MAPIGPQRHREKNILIKVCFIYIYIYITQSNSETLKGKFDMDIS